MISLNHFIRLYKGRFIWKLLSDEFTGPNNQEQGSCHGKREERRGEEETHVNRERREKIDESGETKTSRLYIEKPLGRVAQPLGWNVQAKGQAIPGRD